MAKDSIPLREVAARDVAILEIQCNRHGRLSVKQLLAEWGADASISDIMREQIGACPHRDDTQLYTRCYPYCLDLVRLFGAPDPGGWAALFR